MTERGEFIIALIVAWFPWARGVLRLSIAMRRLGLNDERSLGYENDLHLLITLNT
jgi:hypothetical protein